MSVIVGSEDGQTGTAVYGVKELVVHPNYGQSMFDYEYALLHIKGKFAWSDKVKAVLVPNKAPKVNTTLVVAGWGSTV